MNTIYLNKPGTRERVIVKNVTPEHIEEDMFYYRNQYDVLYGCKPENVDCIIAKNKSDAISYALIFKDLGIYIAVIQVKHDYYVWLRTVDKKVCPLGTGRIVREWNYSKKV